jgi:NhaC family Na+:H+ antiporter
MKTKEVDFMKPISIFYSLFTIFLLIALIAIALSTGLPLFLSIAGTALFAFIVLVFHGYAIKPMVLKFIENLRLVSTVVLLLSLIGILIPILIEIGTLPNFIYYSISWISSLNTMVFAFILSTVLSMLIGTAFGTLTILVPLFIGIATSIHLPEAYIVGALVSGAYFGDRTSPLASSAHLVASVTHTPVRKNIQLMLKGSALPFSLTIALYSLIGKSFAMTDPSNINLLKSAIENAFEIHWLYLSPIILLIVLILLKIPIIRSIGIVCLFSLVIALVQGITIAHLFEISLHGYFSTDALLNTTLKSSGLLNMLTLFAVIVASAALNSFLEIGRMLDALMKPLVKNTSTYAKLTHKTSLLSIIVSLITCNQTLTAIITGRFMNTYYDKNGTDRSYLAKTIGDTGLNLVGLIPWNVNGLLIVSLTGVATLSYAPYAFFTWLLPLFSIFLHPVLFQLKDNKYQ